MSLDINALQGENDRLAASNSGGDFLSNFVRLPDGEGFVVLRFLNDSGKQANKGGLFMATRTHRLNGKSYHCPKELVEGKWKGECPVCRYYNWLWKESEKKSPDEADALQDKARAIKPVERYYYNAIIRQQMDPETQKIEKNVGPKIYSCGKTVHGMIIRAIVGDKELDEKPLGDITDIKEGRDFKLIKKIKKSGNRSYPEYSNSKFEDVSVAGTPEEVKKWMEELHDLFNLRQVKSMEELKIALKVHLGLIEEESEDGFDPSEYEKGSVKQESKVSDNDEDEKVDVVSESDDDDSTTTEVEVIDDDEDEDMADDDFLNSIKDL